MHKLASGRVTMEQLYSHEYENIMGRINNYNIEELSKFLSYLPRLELEVVCQPITRAILKVQLTIKPNFEWNDRWNGK